MNGIRENQMLRQTGYQEHEIVEALQELMNQDYVDDNDDPHSGDIVYSYVTKDLRKMF